MKPTKFVECPCCDCDMGEYAEPDTDSTIWICLNDRCGYAVRYPEGRARYVK